MKFTLKNNSSKYSARTGILETGHGSINTPVFMPVGTIGAVKTMDPNELKKIDFKIILGNTYHLYLRPGTEIVKKAGGLHKFISWDRPILTDSGGFQVFSLSRLNKISNNGVSVERTTNWMVRCSNWLEKNQKYYNHEQVVFPIVQGATDSQLRKISAEQLIEHSSCGMAIGGLAVGEEKNAMMDTIEYCDTLLPKNQPRYLMGVGKPTDLIKSVQRGVDMFDCVMPTRNGRNGHIFTWNGVLNIKNEKYKDDYSALDDCSSHEWGTTFSKSYVRHLFSINEILGLRIASTMNLTFYNDLMVEIRRNINEKSFCDWSDSMLLKMNQMKGM